MNKFNSQFFVSVCKSVHAVGNITMTVPWNVTEHKLLVIACNVTYFIVKDIVMATSQLYE